MRGVELVDGWESAVALGERLTDRLSDRALDRGVCHMTSLSTGAPDR
jgi:hypothetical protein